MAKQVQFRRGSTEEHARFTGAPAEVTVDTATRELVVHDGTTLGGHRQARKGLSDVTQLILSNERPRGSGEVWNAGGFRYLEANPGASDHHVTTEGGAKLYLADDSSDVTAIGAPDISDPTGRGSHSPALVASMKVRRLRGVTLREILGRNYDGEAYDGAATLNAFLPELASEKIAITDPANLIVRVEEPILLHDGLKLHLGPNTTFRKGFANNGMSGGIFSQLSLDVKISDWEIVGGVLEAIDYNQTGKLLICWGDRWTIERTRFQNWRDGQAVMFGGDHGRMINTVHWNDQAAHGTAPLRMFGGSHFRGIGIRCRSGDDQLQFVPITNPDSPGYNLSITDSYFIGCTAHSLTARAAIAAIAGPQNLNSMTAVIHRVGWIGCSGKGVNRTVAIECTAGDGTISRQMDKIIMSGCDWSGVDEDEKSAQSANIQGSFHASIGEIVFSNTSFHGTPRKVGIRLSSPGARLMLDNVHCEGESSALQVVSASSTVIIKGGRYAVKQNGGGNSPGHVIDIGHEANSTRLRVADEPQVDGVASGKSAIRISADGGIARIDSLEAHKAPGAEGTSALSHAPGTTVKLTENIMGNLHTDTVGGGPLSRLP